MTKAQSNILNLLKTIQGSGAFFYASQQDAILPGLKIDGFEELSFPIKISQAKRLISIAERAPYGKGSETITDLKVRSAWEVDKSIIHFNNPKWGDFIAEIENELQKGLGLETKTVKASLYKLLIYEEGDFFLPHKDSEKEKGMFGTLVIALPSVHQGGELILNFNGQTEKIEFAKPCENYKIPYAGFYADCEHEVKPVTKGVRICLTYNLLQIDNEFPIKSPIYSNQIIELAQNLMTMERSIIQTPLIIGLDHQYTTANFSMNQLKHGDKPRVEALFAAVKKCGYYAKLCLLTCYQMGDLEQDYDYYNSDLLNASDNTMSELHEEYFVINHWSKDGVPELGEIGVLAEEIVMSTSFDVQEPIKKEAEGYMGNYGMTVEYWYHYGAVMIWHKSKHISLLEYQSINVQVKWLGYYVEKWDVLSSDEKEEAKQLLLVLDCKAYQLNDKNDLSAIISILIIIDDKVFLFNHQIQLALISYFHKISAEMWIKLITHFGIEEFGGLFNEIINLKEIKKISHLSTLFYYLLADEKNNEILFNVIKIIPLVLKTDELVTVYKSKSTKELIKNLILFNEKFEDENWIKNCEQLLTNTNNRNYINHTLAEMLIDGNFNESSRLFMFLHDFVTNNILTRTLIKPTPPKTWKRKIPPAFFNNNLGKILTPFLDSPTIEVFDYRAAMQKRIEMEAYVKKANIHIICQTIKKGSPHTLRLIKTQNAYKYALKLWEEDLVLLQKLK